MKIVAEIGLAHEGSLGRAMAFIDAVAAAGADAVKFQCHDGDPTDKFREGTSFPQDGCRRAYWERTSFSGNEWRQLLGRTKANGLEFGCSIFAPRAIDSVGWLVDFWKIPSSRIDMQAMLTDGKPIVVSDGWAQHENLQHFAKWLRSCDYLLHCVSQYPCDPTLINLARWGAELTCSDCQAQLGISDHSGTIWPSVEAASLAFQMAEVHVCMSRHDFGPDVSSSITIEELKQLVEGVRFIEKGIQRNASRGDRLAAAKEVMGVFG